MFVDAHKGGLFINCMVNNLAYWDYHRPNGFTALKYTPKGSNVSEKIQTSTEGYLSLMNLLTNSFIESSKQKNQSKPVQSLVSPTTDSNLEESFVESILGTRA